MARGSALEKSRRAIKTLRSVSLASNSLGLRFRVPVHIRVSALNDLPGWEMDGAIGAGSQRLGPGTESMAMTGIIHGRVRICHGRATGRRRMGVGRVVSIHLVYQGAEE